MPGLKITYFPVRGRCSAMRMLLADQGQTWEEEVVAIDQWFSGDMKKSCVFGQLPKVQDGDLVLFQSNAILRYLGSKFGCHGTDIKVNAEIDMINDGVEDLRIKYLTLIYKNYETGKADFIKSLPDELKWFEGLLKNNNKGESAGFIHGEKICYADYNLVDLLLNLQTLEPTCLKELPLLQAYYQRVTSRPALSKYLKSDAHTKLPINGNGKQ
ncbi:glutathione S-transferase P-like isoform X2 [Mobula hypostoma]|uniref:glutathione S-transferase P-like isoform X2 n=1 Tax=Mobula hypostoma TaxID=723540 RepID=UPI002FC3BFA9